METKKINVGGSVGRLKKKPNFQKIIDSLEKQISMIATDYDCNITRRRAEQLKQNSIKRDRLKDFQCKAIFLNEMWDRGNIPFELQGIASFKDMELVSYSCSYPTEEYIENSYVWSREGHRKRKKKFDKWGLDSEEKFQKAKKLLNGLKVELSFEELRCRKIKKCEDDLRGVKIPGFFPTPEALIEKMIGLGDIESYHTVLEPSAGKGDIVDVLKRNRINNVDCIEIVPSLKKILELKGYRVIDSNFLEFGCKKYDRIIMNPPFEKMQDIDHVRKAYSMLKDGGILVSVMSASPFFGRIAKAESFREWIRNVGAEYYKNDDYSFKKAFNMTGVCTYMIKIVKEKEYTGCYVGSDGICTKGIE